MARKRRTPKKRVLAGAVLLGFAYGLASYLALLVVMFTLVASTHLSIEVAAIVLAVAVWVLPFGCTLWQVHRELRPAEQAHRLAAVVEFSGEAILTSDLGGTVTRWNPAARRLYGYTSAEIIGKPVTLLSAESRKEDDDAARARIKAGQSLVNFESTGLHKDGSAITVMHTISPVCDADGSIVGVSAITCDATEVKQAAEYARSLAAAEDLVRIVLASASTGIAMADLDGSIRVVNRSLCELLGRDEAWFLTRQLREIVHPEDVEAALEKRTRLLLGSVDTGAASLRLVRADGATVRVRYTTVLIRDANDQPNMVMTQVEDSTAEHEAREALAYQATHDPLTRLHNRAWILDILTTDLAGARRSGTAVGALFVDLDNFKVINDSLGHGAGDQVLTGVASRIAASLRAEDRVGRVGDDEFVVVVQDVQGAAGLERCAARITTLIGADLQVGGHRIVPSASIGMAVSTAGATPETLLRDADSALHRAKAAGRGRWQLFDEEMHEAALARLIVEDQLRGAISAGELVVFYQPIVTLADATVAGHEALVRWAHPTRGLLSPADFLDVAEDSGLIIPLGAQVLDQACATLAEYPNLPGPISVNVSAVQLSDPGWLGSVMDTLARHGVDPARIVIEVTETAALSLTGAAAAALTTLSGLGAGIHLDDFGTGFSAISMLRDLPVTGVKLDMRFVHDLTTGASQANALAHGLAGLVNGMNLTGIAEGVETAAQADILRTQGWACGQGYLFGRPSPTPAVTALAAATTT